MASKKLSMKRKPFLNNPTVLLFVVLNIWLGIMVAISLANEYNEEAWEDSQTLCSSEDDYSLTDVMPLAALSTMFLSQVSILLYLVLIEFSGFIPIAFSRKKIVCVPFNGSGPGLSRMDRNISNVLLAAFYIFAILAFAEITYISSNFSACFLVGELRHPSIGHLMCGLFFVVFSITLIYLLRTSTATRLVILSENETVELLIKDRSIYVRFKKHQFYELFRRISQTLDA